jgi:hypothetical protein
MDRGPALQGLQTQPRVSTEDQNLGFNCFNPGGQLGCIDAKLKARPRPEGPWKHSPGFSRALAWVYISNETALKGREKIVLHHCGIPMPLIRAGSDKRG